MATSGSFCVVAAVFLVGLFLPCLATDPLPRRCQAVCSRSRTLRLPCGPFGLIGCLRSRTELHPCECDLRWVVAGDCSAQCGGGRVLLVGQPINCRGREVVTPCETQHGHRSCNLQECSDTLEDTTTDVTTEGGRPASSSSTERQVSDPLPTSDPPEGEEALTREPGSGVKATTLENGPVLLDDVTTPETADIQDTMVTQQADANESDRDDADDETPVLSVGDLEAVCQSHQNVGRTFPDSTALNGYFRCGSEGLERLTCAERFDAETGRCAPYCSLQETGFRALNCTHFLLCLLGQALPLTCPPGEVYDEAGLTCAPGPPPEHCL